MIAIGARTVVKMTEFAWELISTETTITIGVVSSFTSVTLFCSTFRPLGYEMVHLPLCKVADAPFHIQGGDL